MLQSALNFIDIVSTFTDGFLFFLLQKVINDRSVVEQPLKIH